MTNKNDDLKYITIKPNGSKRISIRIGHGIDGKYLYDTKQFGKDVDLKTVKKERDIMLENRKKNKNIDGSMSLESFAKKWLTEIVLNQSPNTYDDCYSKLKNHIIPYLKDIKLKNINKDIIQELINYLEKKKSQSNKEKTLSPSTIKHIIHILSGMLNYAVELHMINDNPCNNLRLPVANKFEKEVYSIEEMQELIIYLKSQDILNKTLFTLLITTGMRRGEVAALRWDDIDFDKQMIIINKAYYKTKIKGFITTSPKSKTSNRKIGLTDIAIETLLEYKKEQDKIKNMLANKWKNAPNVFTDNIGNPLSPDAISNRWKRLVKKLPLKNIRLHDLRASFATGLVYMNTPIADVSRTMGHSRNSTTFDLYVRNYEDYYTSAKNNMNTIFHS